MKLRVLLFIFAIWGIALSAAADEEEGLQELNNDTIEGQNAEGEGEGEQNENNGDTDQENRNENEENREEEGNTEGEQEGNADGNAEDNAEGNTGDTDQENQSGAGNSRGHEELEEDDQDGADRREDALDNGPQIVINTTAPQTEIDLQVLEVFYRRTKGRYWTNNDGWSDVTNHHCTWFGVACNPSKIVEKLYLFDNGLEGTIPSELGLLAGLINLNLGMNGLTGTIPSELGKLNMVNGFIGLEMNCLSGSVPAEVFALTLPPYRALVDVDYNEDLNSTNTASPNFEINGLENLGMDCKT